MRSTISGAMPVPRIGDLEHDVLARRQRRRCAARAALDAHGVERHAQRAAVRHRLDGVGARFISTWCTCVGVAEHRRVGPRASFACEVHAGGSFAASRSSASRDHPLDVHRHALADARCG